MKIRLLVFGLGISFLGMAQLPVKLKCDTLIYSNNKETALIISGKTSAIWSLEQEKYIVPATKNKLINFPHSNHYAEINTKTGKLSIHFIDDGNYVRVNGDATSCYIGLGHPQTAGAWADYNGLIVDLESDSVNSDYAPAPGAMDWSHFGIEKTADGLYIVNSYENVLEIIGTHDGVYIGGFNGSGVFDPVAETWLVEPVYKYCYHTRDCFFGLNEIGYKDDQKEFSYDVYRLKEGDVHLLKSGVKQADEMLVRDLLDAEQVTQLYPDYFQFSTVSGGLSGLVKMGLVSYNSFTLPEMSFTVLLEPRYDYILCSPEWHKVATFKENGAPALQLFEITDVDTLMLLTSGDNYVGSDNFTNLFNDYTTVYIGDWWEHVHGNFNADTVEHFPISGYRKIDPVNVSIQHIRDSLLIIHDYDYDDVPDVPFMSYIGEDSMVQNAEGYWIAVYPPAQPGFSRSGIYNLNTMDWLLQPDNTKLKGGAGGFIAEKAISGGLEFIGSSYQFWVYDAEGNVVDRNLEYLSFEMNPQLYKYGVKNCAVDSLFDAPNGWDHHSQFKRPTNKHYYLRCDDKLSVFDPLTEFYANVNYVWYDFVYENPSIGLRYFIQGDSIYLQTPTDTFAVSVASGSIVYEQQHGLDEIYVASRCLIIEGNDTLVLRRGTFYKEPSSVTYTSIDVDENYLVINDRTTAIHMEWIEQIDANDLFYSEVINLESENSAVWQKQNNAWVKVSPYYATIERLSNGWYIASSGYFDRDFSRPGEDPITEKLEKRYFLLDSNFHAISYLDYFDFPHIEDLGFGIKIKLDNARYFFMTYGGKAITNADWDHFEMENGKLKAMLFTTYMYDENGKLVYDEFGLPVELSTETVKYFKL